MKKLLDRIKLLLINILCTVVFIPFVLFGGIYTGAGMLCDLCEGLLEKCVERRWKIKETSWN